MRIDMNHIKGIAVVAPWGRLMGGPDTTELDERLYSLLGRDEKRVILDLGNTRWINSTGISVLIHHWKKFRDAGAELRLANLTDKALHVLTIAKLMTVFDEFESVEAAVESFTGSGGAGTKEKIQ